MRFIPTKFHAPLDYIVGAALIAAPWIFQFSEHTAATVVPVVLGIGLIAYSLFTNYELGVWKVAPMAVHNLIDIAAGTLLAASPWIFGFADETANVWVPHRGRRPGGRSSSASRPSSRAATRTARPRRRERQSASPDSTRARRVNARRAPTGAGYEHGSQANSVSTLDSYPETEPDPHNRSKSTAQAAVVA